MPMEGPESSNEDTDDMNELLFTKRGCCFWIPCLKSNRSHTSGSPFWERIRTSETDDRWWSKGWKGMLKVREWSEIIAGPKWKTFIRRFNKKGGGGGKLGKFQYDPLSYSLNFDEGAAQNGYADEDLAFRDFSSRYAVIPASAKSSMDLRKDGPTFT